MNDPFTDWLRQLWEVEAADRNMKHEDDYFPPLERLSEAHAYRQLAYIERDFYPWS